MSRNQYPISSRSSSGEIRAQRSAILSTDERLLRNDVQASRRSGRTSLRDLDTRFELAAQVTSEGLWDLDCRTGEVSCSVRLREILGLTAGEDPRYLKDWTSRIFRKDLQRVFRRWILSCVKQGKPFEADFRCVDGNGNWRWLRTKALAQWGPTGKVLRIVGSASDITVHKQTDPLTGLHNRPSVLEHIRRRIERAGQESRNFALYFLDLDSFKLINDTLGHASGDALLKEVARRISQTLPPTTASIAARIGGDEFVVLVDDLESEPDALMFGDLLEYILSAPYALSQTVSTTISIGVAFGSPDRLLNVEQMLEEADIAMYSVKTNGKADCVLYTPSMRSDIEKRVRLHQELRLAIAENQFELYYHPIVDFTSGRTIGVEALLRWRHPERGLLDPPEFIPMAEATGLIEELGALVFRESVETLSAWIQNGWVSRSFQCAVNVSVLQLQRPNLIPWLLSLCEQSNLSPKRLRLEMTESALMENLPVISKALQAAVDAGIGLDLDDFGTGFSSLSYLQDFPFHCMKINAAFTKRIVSDAKTRTLVATMLRMADSLEMEVIVEGVETKEQAFLLNVMGCKQMQGYLYSKPLPRSVLEEQWLGNARRRRARQSSARVICATG